MRLIKTKTSNGKIVYWLFRWSGNTPQQTGSRCYKLCDPVSIDLSSKSLMLYATYLGLIGGNYSWVANTEMVTYGYLDPEIVDDCVDGCFDCNIKSDIIKVLSGKRIR